MHVDEFIDEPDSDDYASFVLYWFRARAVDHQRYSRWMRQFKLFCTCDGKRYRVTGASRLGDVWLSADFERESGYELRVDVDKCSEWSDSHFFSHEEVVMSVDTKELERLARIAEAARDTVEAPNQTPRPDPFDDLKEKPVPQQTGVEICAWKSERKYRRLMNIEARNAQKVAT